MQLTTLLTLTLASLASAKPYYGQYNWTTPMNSTMSAGCGHASSTGAALPTGTGSPSLTSSTALPIFTGAAARPRSEEMLGLVLAVGGGVALFV